MKAITPKEVLEKSYKIPSTSGRVNELIGYVNEQIAAMRFEHTSNDYFQVNIFRYMWMGSAVFDKTVELLKQSGWEAYHKEAYSGHGSFYAIFIRTDKVNTKTVSWNPV